MPKYRYTGAELTRLLQAADSKLLKETHLLVIGGSAIVLAHDPTGATKDLDTLSDIEDLENAFAEASKETGIDAKLERVTIAESPYDFEERCEAILIPGLTRLRIFIPEKHDLALMKTMRGDENDIDGITRIHRSSGLDLRVMIDRFCNEMGHVNGNPRTVRFNFLNVIEQVFGEEALKEAEAAVTRKFGPIP